MFLFCKHRIKMKDGLKTGIVRCVGMLILAVLSGAILITIANYLPINEKNLQESMDQMAKEGWFPEVPSMEGGYGSFHSMNPTALELATDNLMIKMALYDGEDKGIVQAFRCYSTQYEDEYSRYWHGYVVILRFLLMFFNYYEIRILNGIAQILLFCAVAYFIKKRSGKKYVAAIATSYILLMPAALAQCLQYSWIYYVAFGALLLYLKFQDYFETGTRYIYFFLLLGAVTTYLDLLTYPLLTWGLVIVWWILLQKKSDEMIQYIIKVINSALAWIAGYFFMWAGKWAVGSLILRENLFKRAISEAFLWTINEGEDKITSGDRLQAIYLNWKVYSYKIYFFILIAWIIYVVLKGIKTGYKKDSRLPALLLVGFSSIVWYVFFAGHVTMHHIFTHRIFSVTAASFLGIVLISTAEKDTTLKDRIKSIFAIAAMGLISVFLMLQLRADYSVYNYANTSFEPTPVKDTAAIQFVPSFSKVKSINVGISADDGCEGYYKMMLMDGEKTLYEEMIPIQMWAEGNYHELPVDWQLQIGKQYSFQIELTETNENIYIWAITDGSFPLAEFGNSIVDEEITAGQMLAGVTYWCRPVGKYNCMFWTVTIMGVCFMIYMGVRSIEIQRRI